MQPASQNSTPISAMAPPGRAAAATITPPSSMNTTPAASSDSARSYRAPRSTPQWRQQRRCSEQQQRRSPRRRAPPIRLSTAAVLRAPGSNPAGAPCSMTAILPPCDRPRLRSETAPFRPSFKSRLGQTARERQREDLVARRPVDAAAEDRRHLRDLELRRAVAERRIEHPALAVVLLPDHRHHHALDPRARARR